MGQFVPLDTATALGPDEVGVLERGLHGEAAVTWKFERLRPEPVRGDEALFEPVADRPFGLAGCRRDRLDLVGVEARQRVVGVGVLLDVRRGHCGGIGGQTRPQLTAHHLKLHRLDMRTLIPRRYAVSGHHHRTQIAHQLPGGVLGELHTHLVGGQLHGGEGRAFVEEVEATPGGQPSREHLEVRVEVGDEVLAHRDNRPHTTVAEQCTELREERCLHGDVDGVESEHLFELIEHEAQLAVGVQIGEGRVRHVLGQRHRSQRGAPDAPVGRLDLVE